MSPILKRTLVIIAFICVALGGFAYPSGAESELPEVMFILDGSGSMWGQTAGRQKIEAAKDVMAKIVPSLPSGVKVGLTVYGHRRKGDCKDVEILIPAGSDDRDGLLTKVNAISPKGKTPMAASVQMVAEELKTRENETTIVLVSDGIETCHDDPCGVIKSLKEAGVKFVLYVVGFDVDEKGKEQLECMAKAGDGVFFSASDADSLLTALETVKKDVAVKVEKATTKTVSAKSKLGKLQISMPQSAVPSLAGIKIVREKDGKVLKEIKPQAESQHPLLAGTYQVVLAYAASNYQPPHEALIGASEVKGGETTELDLGAMVINRAEGLADAAEAVLIYPYGSDDPLVKNDAKGNDYYLWKAKPLAAGTYDLALVYSRSDEIFPVFRGIEIEPGKETVVTLDSGFQLKPNPQIESWELVPSGQESHILKVKRRFDNDWPLFASFPVEPGTYDLNVFLKGMQEPLPAGEGIVIDKGQKVVFDPGL